MAEAWKSVWPFAVVAFCSVLGALGQGFFKAGAAAMKTSALQPAAWATNGKLILGLGFYGAATVLFVYTLSQYNKISALYPVIALSYVWVLGIARFWFRESVSPANWAGAAVIVAGVALATWKTGA